MTEEDRAAIRQRMYLATRPDLATPPEPASAPASAPGNASQQITRADLATLERRLAAVLQMVDEQGRAIKRLEAFASAARHLSTRQQHDLSDIEHRLTNKIDRRDF